VTEEEERAAFVQRLNEDYAVEKLLAAIRKERKENRWYSDPSPMWMAPIFLVFCLLFVVLIITVPTHRDLHPDCKVLTIMPGTPVKVFCDNS
jgi:uncharacterized membrane protein